MLQSVEHILHTELKGKTLNMHIRNRQIHKIQPLHTAEKAKRKREHGFIKQPISKEAKQKKITEMRT